MTWCDEVIVIDDESTDKSASVAEKSGAKVYKRALNNNFADQRNFGLTKARNEWVFFVDADEVVPPELAEEIYQQTSQFLTELTGYYIKRQDHLWGRVIRFGEVGKAKFLRLAKKDKGRWVGQVHEEWKLLGQIGTLQNTLHHYPHHSVRR